jgi:hypothetical protein
MFLGEQWRHYVLVLHDDTRSDDYVGSIVVAPLRLGVDDMERRYTLGVVALLHLGALTARSDDYVGSIVAPLRLGAC